MIVHFENIGRNKATFDRELPSHFKPTLDALVDEYEFLAKNCRGYLRSTPDFDVNKDGKKIGVFAGFFCVGEITLKGGRL